ncbi:MAG TPA: hypothetical protein VK937_03950 [Candidatus Limnocylindria bacterium]|nr:hypothetical protein [Candidatus Limnocylindria bacterium]
MIQLDGTIKRVLRAEVLGLAGELSERAARNKMAVLLRPINGGKYRPEATITFGQFLKECWEPAVVPQLKHMDVLSEKLGTCTNLAIKASGRIQ